MQRKRVKGWKMPENTVSVARPGKFGNPFKLMGDMLFVDAGHRRKILSRYVLFKHEFVDAQAAVKVFRDLLMDLNSHEVEQPIYDRMKYMRDRIGDLAGKNLACFCPLDQPCHADVLLEFAKLWEESLTHIRELPWA